MVERVERRVREQNSQATVVGAVGGQIDSRLLYDVGGSGDEPGQLSLRELLVNDTDIAVGHDHVHADSVTVTTDGDVDPGALIDLLEDPPVGVYRLKGAVKMRYGRATPTFAVNLVGPTIHIANAPRRATANFLVAIGMRLNTEDVRARLDAALRPCRKPPTLANIHRLRRYRRHSL
jgi:G3E family GTPase